MISRPPCAVSLHVPLTEKTRGLIDAAALAQMKPDAMLVNAARGEIVDLDALAAALEAGRIAGAALDVFAQEPYEPAEGRADFRELPNVILTPHVGSNTVAANRRMAERALQNIVLADARAFARMDLVNPEVLT